ncbi:MAG: DNA polymerase I [Candidatus Omnitrophota bacterium]
MKRLFLIDGNSFCYRAFYAIKHLTNSKGQATNAVYGFGTMLKKIITDENPDMMAVAFDLKEPTFRHKKFEDYKITRKPMPDDLKSQMPLIKRLVKAYNLPIYELAGYEADDILATLAKRAEGKSIDTFIVTSDKDAFQLIGPHIKVYNPQKEGLVYDREDVVKRYGVEPERMTDLMALMGDTSDNIPGVPGIGEKGAIELMKQFSSLEELLKNTGAVKSQSHRKKIEESRDLAIMSKELATVDKDVPLVVDFGDLILREPDRDQLIELFKELEFRSLLKDMLKQPAEEKSYHLVDSMEAFTELIDALKGCKRFAFDFETTQTDPMRARAVGVSFCWKQCVAYYIPLNALKGISRSFVIKELKPIFENEKIKKIGQNIKYDLLILKNLGIAAKGTEFDTMLASYLLNPSKSRHNLSEISFEYLERTLGSIKDLIGKGKSAITMDMVDVGKVRDYCCEDSDVTFTLSSILKKSMAEKGLKDLFYSVEMPLIDVLTDIEWWGVSINAAYLKELSRDMEKEIKKLQRSIYVHAGETFNINSPKQLQGILFEKLKMPVIKRTKTGASTNEEVLKVLSEQAELPKEILRYRALAKLKSTYVDSLPDLINPKTGRIHTSFNQTVTATGRLSSSGPNLQNIPVKTEMGRKIRRAFIAGNTSQVILAADYSQIELRVLAHLSADKNLIEAFAENKDIHVFTASLIYGLPEKDVTPEMRSAAKTVNFGIIYGMSAYGLSRDLGIDVLEASRFIESYFERYPGIKDYFNEKISEAKTHGFVTTILGRRRYIPEISSSNTAVKNFAERTAVNTPIQGSAADLIKLAMIKIHKGLSNYRAKMIMQVHDELVFEIDKKSLTKFSGFVKTNMEHVLDLKVPITVSLESGPNWLDMEKVEC